MKHICYNTRFEFSVKPFPAFRLHPQKYTRNPETGKVYHPEEIVGLVPVKNFLPIEYRLMLDVYENERRACLEALKTERRDLSKFFKKEKSVLPENKFKVVIVQDDKIIIKKKNDSSDHCLLMVGYYHFDNRLVPVSKGVIKVIYTQYEDSKNYGPAQHVELIALLRKGDFVAHTESFVNGECIVYYVWDGEELIVKTISLYKATMPPFLRGTLQEHSSDIPKELEGYIREEYRHWL